MTRINTTMLTGKFTHDMLLDQHLFIAYREVTRVHKLHRKPKPGELFPKEYVLGTGHVKFFYNKGAFLAKQCEELYQALLARGYNPTHKEYKQHADGLHNDWQPNMLDHAKLIVRLHEKLVDKPTFYTLHGKPVSETYYLDILAKVTRK